MTERVGLGHSDADGRWLGLRPHQAVLAAVGVAVALEGIMQRSSVGWAGAVMVAGSPALAGRSLAERVSDGARFLARRRVVRVSVVRLGDDALITASATASLAPAALQHRGRLDLTDADRAVAGALAAALGDASERTGARHVSLHTEPRRGTLLAAAPGSAPPPGWRVDDGLLEVFAGLGDAREGLWLERWGYLRDEAGVARVWRVGDLTAASEWSLASLARPGLTVAVHLEALSSARSRRRSEMLVHAERTDQIHDARIGRGRRARRQRDLARSRELEGDVAAGSPLAHLAVFVVARAPTLAALARRTAETESRARRLGLRLERGGGRQGPWFRAQLPGGPGW